MGNIVWLASYPKSGNTWLRAFLANLIADRPTPVGLTELHAHTDEEARADRFGEVSGRPDADLGPVELAQLRESVHALIAGRVQRTCLVKTHNVCGEFEGYALFNWQVTAGAIYVVRNPLDVVVSIAHHYRLTLDDAIVRLADESAALPDGGGYVRQFIGSWSTHVKGWADMASGAPGRTIVLRYEDLLANPARHFAKVAAMLGMGADHARIARAVTHASFQTLASLERTYGFAEAVDRETPFFFRGRAGQWRDVLTLDQVELVVASHRVQMRRFGYVPPGYGM